MFYGVQYYRPRHPLPEYWQSDLQQIREAGFDRIRIWLLWSDVQPDPDRWDWSVYDRLMGFSEQAALQVLIQLMPESAPYWINHLHPEWLIQDISARRFYLCGESSLMGGSFPGVTPFNPEAVAACRRFLEETARHFADRPNLWAWDAWNELYREDDYSMAALADWRAWLLRRYGSADGLATKWRRPITDIGDVFFPPQEFTHWKGTLAGSVLERLDLSRWHFDVINRQLDWRVQCLRRGDPNHPIVAHSHGFVTTRMDAWEAGRRVDLWGASSHDTASPWITKNCDFTRASSPAGGWFLAEMTSGSVFFGFGHAKRTLVELRDQPIWGWAFGALGVVYWQWRPEIFGHEATQFGMTDLAGSDTERTKAVQESMAFFRDNAEVLDGIQWDPPDTGILWDPDSQALPQVCRGAGDSSLPERHWEQWYCGLWQAGLNVVGLHAPSLAETGIPESICLLVAPTQFMAQPGIEETLKEWVERGGTLLAGPAFLWFDHDALLRQWPGGPCDLRAFAPDWEFPTGSAGAVGDSELWRFSQTEADAETSRSSGALVGHDVVWGEDLHLPIDQGPVYVLERQGAEPVATWRGLPVALRYRCGNGQIYYLGIWRTVETDGRIDPPWRKLTIDVVSKAGIAPPVLSRGHTWLRLGTTAKGDRLVVAFNATNRLSDVVLSSRQPLRKIRSLKSDQDLGLLGSDHDLRLGLEAHEVEVLLWERSSWRLREASRKA